jgi:hypothetical protein
MRCRKSLKLTTEAERVRFSPNPSLAETAEERRKIKFLAEAFFISAK